MNQGFIKVAAGTPQVTVADCKANTRAILEVIREMETQHAKLMVLPEKQGRGIGTQLLVAIEKSCPKPRYELFTSNISIRNLKLYEGLGYRRFREEQVTPELKFVYMEKTVKVPAGE